MSDDDDKRVPVDPEPQLGDLIRPTPGRIVVQIETRSEITPSGLMIPIGTAQSIHEARATQGVVVALGDEDDDDDDATLASAPHVVSVGDTVLFGKYTGTRITWQPDRTKERQEVVVMNEKDVLAVLLSPAQAKNIKVKV